MHFDILNVIQCERLHYQNPLFSGVEDAQPVSRHSRGPIDRQVEPNFSGFTWFQGQGLRCEWGVIHAQLQWLGA